DGFFWHPEISSALYARLKPTLLWLATSPKPTGRRHKEVLSNLLLCGWTLRDEQTGTRWTTSDELKSVLVNGDDDFRTQTLWQVAHWPQAEEKVSLLTEVWPKQIAARSPRVTAGLCDIPFDDEENFEVLVAAILPLVSTLEDRTLVVPSMRHPDSTILERYPQKALALLWAVLPQDATNWPYGAGDALLRICSTEGSLLHDHRMIELLRRWNKH
ncbi:MAG TPA: hypothetical protein VNF73_11515, partial [Candidatus Saccharimonadales bacterium]|nr:hypothetical protein [Candidatus Saccharimonadales bacterium]